MYTKTHTHTHTAQFEDYCSEVASTAAWGGQVEVSVHNTYTCIHTMALHSLTCYKVSLTHFIIMLPVITSQILHAVT